MVFKTPVNGQQVPHEIRLNEMDSILRMVRQEVRRAEKKFPKWPKDLNYGDQIINEEKGEATKALLDICQGKAEICDAQYELIQTAAMCVRQIAAIERMLMP